MTELANAEIVDKEPSTKFGKSMVDFAKRLDTWSKTETELTHKDMVKSLGAATIVGGAILAIAPSFVGSPEITASQVYDIVRDLAKSHINFSYFDGGVSVESSNTETYISSSHTNLETLAKNLVDVSQKALIDRNGNPLFLLSPEKSTFISEQLEKVKSIKDLVAGVGGVGVLAGIGTMAGSMSSVISSEKVVNSTSLVPAFANLVSKIGQSF